MHRQKILSRSLIVVAFALLAAPWAAAQQYRIVRADYGWRDHRVDVTQRLRELARHDARFRMGNSTFGIDPAPGHVKTLRIYAKGPGGDRVFEYREGQTVDGAIFSGWGRGDWGDRGDRNPGGRYVILHALYGTKGRNVDVTDRLRDLARRNATFRMGNSTFGVDPAPGRVKELRIYARGPNGQTRMFSYREGSVVDGGMFSGWGRGDWGRGGWHGGWDSGGPGGPR